MRQMQLTGKLLKVHRHSPT